MTILDSILLGIVEGFTEFLPISSTAHLMLASYLLGLEQSDFVKTFEIAIQSGAVLAVIVLYWKKFTDWQVLRKILAAFIPTAVIGLLIYKFAKEYLIGNLEIVLWTLGVGGVLFIAFEFLFKHDDQAITDIKMISYGKAASIGLVQAVAIVPGVSRSAATIIGGLFMGLSREAVVEFSFLLAVPTILAATVLDLYKNAALFSSAQIGSLSIGFTASFVTAIFGIKFLLSFIKNKSWLWFGVYRILLVLLFVLFVI